MIEIDRPLYLADIFAEVHLTFLMSYFLLEVKVDRLFVSPFHRDIVGTEFRISAYAISGTSFPPTHLQWTNLFIKGLK